MAKQTSAADRLRVHALALPEAAEDFPWGHRVAKVRTKIFVFLADDSLGVKLNESLGAALGMRGIEPMRYNLGKHGWVRISLATGPPVDILLDWIEESYALIAPKTLIARMHS